MPVQCSVSPTPRFVCSARRTCRTSTAPSWGTRWHTLRQGMQREWRAAAWGSGGVVGSRPQLFTCLNVRLSYLLHSYCAFLVSPLSSQASRLGQRQGHTGNQPDWSPATSRPPLILCRPCGARAAISTAEAHPCQPSFSVSTYPPPRTVPPGCWTSWRPRDSEGRNPPPRGHRNSCPACGPPNRALSYGCRTSSRTWARRARGTPLPGGQSGRARHTHVWTWLARSQMHPRCCCGLGVQQHLRRSKTHTLNRALARSSSSFLSHAMPRDHRAITQSPAHSVHLLRTRCRAALPAAASGRLPRHRVQWPVDPLQPPPDGAPHPRQPIHEPCLPECRVLVTLCRAP